MTTNETMPDEIYISMGRDTWEASVVSGTRLYVPADLHTAPKWQPIETAPRDQSDILAIGIYNNHWWSALSIVYWEPFEDRGWLCSRRHIPVNTKPTHWMPLPPPPTNKTEG